MINAYVNDRIRTELNVAVPASNRAVPGGLSPLGTAPAPPLRQAPGMVRAGLKATLERTERAPEPQRTARELQHREQADKAAAQGSSKLARFLGKYGMDNGGADFVDVCMREMARNVPGKQWPKSPHSKGSSTVVMTRDRC